MKPPDSEDCEALKRNTCAPTKAETRGVAVSLGSQDAPLSLCRDCPPIPRRDPLSFHACALYDVPSGNTLLFCSFKLYLIVLYQMCPPAAEHYFSVYLRGYMCFSAQFIFTSHYVPSPKKTVTDFSPADGHLVCFHFFPLQTILQ